MLPEHRDRCVNGIAESGLSKTKAAVLLDAGFWPVKRLREASDVQLLAIPGIGQAAINKIRTWIGY